MESLIPIFAIAGVFGSGSYIAYVILEIVRSRQRAGVTREFTNKLLDRVTSTQDLGAFMNTEGGARLLASIGGIERSAPHHRILRALQSGIVLLVLGLGLFGYAFVSPTIPLEGFEVITMLATVAVSLGVGLLLAAGAAMALSHRLGMLDGQPPARAVDSVHPA